MSWWSKIKESVKKKKQFCSYHQCRNYINDNCRWCNTPLKSTLMDGAFCPKCQKYSDHFTCCYIHRCRNEFCQKTVSLNVAKFGYCEKCYTWVCQAKECDRLAYPWNHCFDHRCRHNGSKCLEGGKYHGYCKKHK